MRAEEKETAATWQTMAALREAELGNSGSVRQQVAAALALAPGRDVTVVAALALARIGDSAQALKLADHLNLGFDCNEYPGDETLKVLRRTFSFSGYWLNNPPGASSNSWTGKRKVLQAVGFGFLLVFNGRTDAQIRSAGDATKLGSSDGALAVSSARAEGFSRATTIFLDQEEGGRLLPEQRAYLFGWLDAVASAGFRVGVYCSGIAFKEGSGSSIITAVDIQQNAGGRELAYWVSNDACPPSPGCAFPRKPPTLAESGVSFAEVWQFAQSPRSGESGRR